jgi:hypothetical protein
MPIVVCLHQEPSTRVSALGMEDELANNDEKNLTNQRLYNQKNHEHTKDSVEVQVFVEVQAGED